jgi:peptidoglycan/LPS O-acetylase OafA/YrhL
MEYRREIDGLRAVAVLPVMLFHGGFGWFGGGFVGVDVFFVISGYLITSIILAEMQSGTFTLAGFYERRARRILPSLFLVTAVCIAIAWFLMLPNQLKEFGRSLIAISIFSSNILFGREANYFATAAELNPLLHTWSLAVEEQFYVGFPLFMLLLWSAKKRWLIGFLAILAVACLSFAYAETRSASRPEITFYLLKARCWELFLGCLIAFARGAEAGRAQDPELGQSIRQVASFTGMGLIAYAVFAFDRGTRFPSVLTLVPTVGAMLVIVFATPSTMVGRLLSHPWLVGLGLISYSAYLWHQPMFAFARILGIGGHWIIAGLAICSIGLAYLTWRYVELPFRNRKSFSRRGIASAAVSMSAAIFGAGMIFHIEDGFPHRLSKEQLEVLAFRSYPTTELYRTGKCLLRTDQPVSEFSPECDAQSGGRSRTLFLWGDSFGAHLYPALKELSGYSVAQYNSVCPPLVGIAFDYGRDCAAVEELILRKVRESKPDVIVLSANWRKHVKYLERIGPTLDRLKSISGGSEIVLVGNVPQWEPSLPEILARSRKVLQRELHLDTVLLKELRPLDRILLAAATSRQARFVSPIGILCKGADCLAVVPDGDGLAPIAYDYGHLTRSGAEFLIRRAGLAR